MSSAVYLFWSKGDWAFYDDGDLQVILDDGSMTASLSPSEAVNLASALLQYATQNADWWKVNGEAE